MTEKEILSDMQRDMMIERYKGEKEEDFTNRILYSSLAHWMRYCILDEATSNYEKKSKTYLYSRIKTLLQTYMDVFLSFKKWVIKEYESKKDMDDIIHELRDKMLTSGEWMIVDDEGNVGLPEYSFQPGISTWPRVVGLSANESNDIYCGITRITKNENFANKESMGFQNILDIKDYINSIERIMIWNEEKHIENYEFFNPKSKRAPYQSWNNHFDGTSITLARMDLYNGMHEYYLMKKMDENYFTAAFPAVLAEGKEERRVLLALRQAHNNSMFANSYDRGNAVILELFCGLPLKEQVLLDTYCWPKNSINDKYHYVVPRVIWDGLKTVLINSLGIEIREK